jgi:hypothetical protein
MANDDSQGRRISRLALKIGRVATAAAALLAENAGSAHESDILNGVGQADERHRQTRHR